MTDPTQRFTGLAEVYSKARPSYPDAAIDRIMEVADLAPDTVLVDIGCGTGISSRLFAERGTRVIGLEPNEDMRKQAEKANAENGTTGNPEYRDGTAEATGLKDASVDAVLAAQAFHWFRADEALQEFARILKPGGWVILMWNERDESEAFTHAYGDALRMSPETAKVEWHRASAGEPILESTLFEEARREVFRNTHALDEEGAIGRAFSASYAPKDEEGRTRLRERLSQAFLEFNKNGLVQMKYLTSVYFARKAE